MSFCSAFCIPVLCEPSYPLGFLSHSGLYFASPPFRVLHLVPDLRVPRPEACPAQRAPAATAIAHREFDRSCVFLCEAS